MEGRSSATSCRRSTISSTQALARTNLYGKGRSRFGAHAELGAEAAEYPTQNNIGSVGMQQGEAGYVGAGSSVVLQENIDQVVCQSKLYDAFELQELHRQLDRTLVGAFSSTSARSQLNTNNIHYPHEYHINLQRPAEANYGNASSSSTACRSTSSFSSDLQHQYRNLRSPICFNPESTAATSAAGNPQYICQIKESTRRSRSDQSGAFDYNSHIPLNPPPLSAAPPQYSYISTSPIFYAGATSKSIYDTNMQDYIVPKLLTSTSSARSAHHHDRQYKSARHQVHHHHHFHFHYHHHHHILHSAAPPTEEIIWPFSPVRSPARVQFEQIDWPSLSPPASPPLVLMSANNSSTTSAQGDSDVLQP